MRTTDEITHNGKTLTEILRLHKMLVYGENGGRRAYLSGTDLSGVYLSGTDLSWADLRGADLSGANLRGANLRGACLSDSNLRWADLRGADLRGAYLSGTDLSGAYLSGAYLSDSNLRGAKFVYKGVKAKCFQVFNNLYRYCVYAILSTDGAQYVRLGCKFYSREDWIAGKGNNHDEFPDDGSEESDLRKFALSTAFAWLDLIVKQEEKKGVRSNQP